MLAVRLIGKFDIQCDGQPVILASRAAQSLFAYLILTAGTLHRREKLAGMLWPDTTEEKARIYLRNELWRIRKTLPKTSKVEYLLADNLTIGFNPASVHWLDVAAFKNISDSAPADEMITRLSCYQGELLAGFYEDWVILEREHLHVLFEQKVACLLELLEKERRWNDVLDWAERWIVLAQAPEAAYRALMVAYDALEDDTKVAATYERCKQALHQLDLEPSEETRALAFKRNPKINIPIPLTSFIGREKELKEVVGLFSKSRLITLTGSGGVGKTRLAIQVVADVLERFPDGVWFLDLAPLSDPALVPNTLASLIGVRESGEIPVTELLINYFCSRTTLVIFDNCEHLIDSCAELIHLLLTSCEHVAVLATSRETLRVSGEIPYRVPSLEVPKPDTEFKIIEISNMEAIKLFVDRAAVVSPRFAISQQNALVIVQICKRLDGIPLAIELAAARSNVLTLEQILKRLDDRFRLLAHGLRSALPRHQTLRATIEWSHELLSKKERVLLRRLAVFSGGWKLEAAEAVCSGSGIELSDILNLLTELVNKSLVLVETAEHETRYRSLETIRQYGLEQLSGSDEEGSIRTRHLDYFLKLAVDEEPNLYGGRQVEWIKRLEEEHSNYQMALTWSLEHDMKAGQGLVLALWWSWVIRGYVSEGYSWIQKALTARPDMLDTTRAKLLSAAGYMAGYIDQKSEKAFNEQSVALFRQLNDDIGLALPLISMGYYAYYHFDYDQARAYFEEGRKLFEKAGNKWGIRIALGTLGMANEAQGNFEKAETLYENSLTLSRETDDFDGITWAILLLGSLAANRGEYSKAMGLLSEGLSYAKMAKNENNIGSILTQIGIAASQISNIEQARSVFEESLSLYREMGNPIGILKSIRHLGYIARLDRDYAKARSLFIDSLKLALQLQDKSNIALCLIFIGELTLAQGRPEEFVRLLGMAESILPNNWRQGMPSYFRNDTQLAVDSARATLGEEAFAAAWEEGKKMTLDEAVAFALNESASE
jgi:Predicted ATPase